MKASRKNGVTLLELLVVLAIMAVLSTIAAGVYTNEILRSRYAKARSDSRTLEIAIHQYEVDTGQFPPSGSGVGIAPGGVDSLGIAQGSGYLRLALMSSLNNNASDPLSRRWRGPYIDWDYNQMGDLSGRRLTEIGNETIPPAQVSFLDPFGNPYLYIRSDDYANRGGTRIPANMPDIGNETYFNPSTFQIISPGADNFTQGVPNRGLDAGDVTNFFAPEN